MPEYSKAQLERQREIADKSLQCDYRALDLLPRIHEDVRENHRRTIQMRIDHYEKRIAALDERIRNAT